MLFPTFFSAGCGSTQESHKEYIEAKVINGSGGGFYETGSSCRFIANEIDGKEFLYWLLGDAEDDNRISAEREIILVLYENITLTAVYRDEVPSGEDFEYVTLTMESSEGDKVYEYIKGSEITIYPDTVGCFEKWIIDGEAVESDEAYTFTINKDTTAKAVVYECNIILGKNGVMSGVDEDYPSSNAFDGAFDTYLQTDGSSESNTITVDLGSAYAVKAFLLSEGRFDGEENYRSTSFKVEYSADNNVWAEAHSDARSISDKTRIILDEEVEARYVRLTYTTQGATVTRLNEFQAYGDKLESVEDGPAYNVALNKAVTVSSTANSKPTTQGANAVDGNMNTQWATAAGYDHYIIVDLGDKYYVESFVLSEKNFTATNLPDTLKGYRIASFRLEYSLDNQQWTEIMSEEDKIGTEREISLESAVSARYLKLSFRTKEDMSIGGGNGMGTQLHEFQAYGRKFI